MKIIRRVNRGYRVLAQRLSPGIKLRKAVFEICANYNPFVAPFIFVLLRGADANAEEVPLFLSPYSSAGINPRISAMFDQKVVIPHRVSRNADPRVIKPPTKSTGYIHTSLPKRLPAAKRGRLTSVIHKSPLRGEPSLSDPVVAWRYTASISCAVSYPTNNRMSPNTRTLTKTSVKTLNWKQLKKRQRPFNPHTFIYEHIYTADGSWGSRISGRPCVEQYDGLIYLKVISTDTINKPWPAHTALDTDARAKSKALEKIKSMKINLGQAFGERKQTVSLITKSVNRIASAALAIKRGNLRHASSLFGDKKLNLRKEIKPSSDNLSNYWLEFQYGWRPLLQDIHGACEQLANTYYLQKPYRVTAVSKGESMISDYQKRRVTAPASADYWSELVDSKRVASTKVVLEFTEDNAFLTAMSQVGLTNPALLAWELLPYSFVVDWFVPLGTYFNNLDAASGLHFVRGFGYTKLQQEDQTRWRQDVVSPYVDKGFLTGNTQHRRYQSKVRTVYTTFPMPVFPSLQPSVGATRALSGLALITQLFSGKTAVR